MRIVKYFQIEENILILSMMNLDKLMLSNQNFTINRFNCYKLFFLSLLATNKLYDDYVIPKSILCKVALIDSSELISLESEFLQKVNYNLFIEEAEFNKYKLKLNNLHDKIKIEIEKKKEEEEIKNKQNKFIKDDLQIFKRKCSYLNYINNAYNADISNNNNICKL